MAEWLSMQEAKGAQEWYMNAVRAAREARLATERTFFLTDHEVTLGRRPSLNIPPDARRGKDMEDALEMYGRKIYELQVPCLVGSHDVSMPWRLGDVLPVGVVCGYHNAKVTEEALGQVTEILSAADDQEGEGDESSA